MKDKQIQRIHYLAIHQDGRKQETGLKTEELKVGGLQREGMHISKSSLSGENRKQQHVSLKSRISRKMAVPENTKTNSEMLGVNISASSFHYFHLLSHNL